MADVLSSLQPLIMAKLIQAQNCIGPDVTAWVDLCASARFSIICSAMP